MKYIKTIISISLSVALVSCEDVIELDVPEGNTRVVVEGLITNLEEVQTIKLTTTKPYFDGKPIPVITGATVTVTDDAGGSYVMEETSPGTYQKMFAGVVGRTYKLSFISPSGEHYESLTETLKPVAPIGKIYSEFEKESVMVEEEGNYVSITVSDPSTKNDHYKWRFYVNDEMKNKPEDLYYANDMIFNGTENIIITFSNHALKSNDHAKVEQMSISEGAYDFLHLLFLQTAEVGSQFDTPPAPVKGNIINKNNPENYALGYFMVSAIETAEIVIEGSVE